MRRAFLFCLGLSLAGICAYAGEMVAAVSSSSSFELDGVSVDTAGVSSWPLMVGDRIASKNAPLVIALKDGSRITLAENSRLQLASVGSELSANLTSGSMRYSLSSGSKLRVLQGGTPVVGRSGDVSGSSSGKVGTTKSQSFLFSPPPPPGPISAR